MGNPLLDLIAEPEGARIAKGTRYTPQEIAQQPEMWRETARRVYRHGDRLEALLKDAGVLVLPARDRAKIVLTGAGTSHFIGRSLAGLLTGRFATDAEARPSTDIVTHPEEAFLPGRNYLLVLFGRSGDSPETLEAFRIVTELYPDVRQVAVTCNAEGALAKGRKSGQKTALILLSEATNDRGLAMTGSFTSMVVAGQALAYIEERDEYLDIVERLARAGENVLEYAPTVVQDVVNRGFSRAFLLGSGCLKGCAAEAGLKLQEMTAGEIMSGADSFVGVRHGPQAVIRDDTLIVYFVSSDPFVRRYEIDLVRENRAKRLGCSSIAVIDSGFRELADMVDHVIEFDPDGKLGIPDTVRPPVDVIVGQLLGLFAAVHRGIKPDTPSQEGIIHRVVEGVTIYPRQ